MATARPFSELTTLLHLSTEEAVELAQEWVERPAELGMGCEHTGGGCYAWVYRFPDETELWITDNDAQLPDPITGTAVVGYYPEEGPGMGWALWVLERFDTAEPFIITDEDTVELEKRREP